MVCSYVGVAACGTHLVGNHYDKFIVACKGDKQDYGPEWGLSRR